MKVKIKIGETIIEYEEDVDSTAYPVCSSGETPYRGTSNTKSELMLNFVLSLASKAKEIDDGRYYDR